VGHSVTASSLLSFMVLVKEKTSTYYPTSAGREF